MTEKKQEKQNINHKCSRCGSGFGYFQIKTGKWVCRNCSYIEEVKREIKN